MSQPGTVTIKDERDKRNVITLFAERFDDVKALRKLLFNMKGSPYTVIVIFDN